MRCGFCLFAALVLFVIAAFDHRDAFMAGLLFVIIAWWQWE